MTPGNTGTKSRRRLIPTATVIAVTAIGVGVSITPAWAAPPIPDSGTLTWSITNQGDTPGNAVSSPGQPATTEFDHNVLNAPVDTVYATLDATVAPGASAEVDVRGLRPDGTWTEWVDITEETAAVLPETTDSVQTRLVVTASEGAAIPQVRQIDLVGWDDAHAG